MIKYDLSQRNQESKYKYLHRCLRDDIQKGNIQAGKKLPPKRELAKELGVSVNTVERAYSLLVSEGYVEAKVGSGFVVCPGRVSANPIDDLSNLDNGSNPRGPGNDDQERPLDLKANRCSLELFPLDTWSRLMRQVLNDKDAVLLETVPFNGLLVLRRAIAWHLHETKGISVSPDRIIIGAGTEYLYGRLLQLLGGNRIIAMEDPGYKKFADISKSAGILWEYVPLDEKGLLVNALRNSGASIVHVSPANHFPTGVTMSADRRHELLDWLTEDPRRYIIEDDYDSEIDYGGRTYPSLMTQDMTQRVIYLNTFSKTLVPSLRISYLVLPEALMEMYHQQLSFYSCTVSSFEQMTLARFISEGYFDRHIHRLRRYYKQHRSNIIESLKESSIYPHVSILRGNAGTHFLLRIRTTKSDGYVKQLFANHKVSVAMLSDYCARPSAMYMHDMVINFASIPPFGINKAVKLIEEVFQEGDLFELA